ncbi:MULTISPECIES: Uma2 family endonuclease [Amycolatopsis]|uniref:Endonuclease, Uma2 family (Restriction endonuclease fold) n=2 Tax=Amycolatopsis TaxID=1813 RepID=A0A1I4ATX5_9PSEU|nr:Uma2 family endonuclease [Amycolatopsis sacchari]SFK59925.1 Endonuclease, Uma2 family (restriction endonuclease fold) [Amycolatopsis sacchari]
MLGPTTVEEWLAAERSRLELLLGHLYAPSRPSGSHQRASFRLARAVDDSLQAVGRRDLEVLPAVAVRISTPFRTVLVPDLAVVKVGEDRRLYERGDVLLAVEVWSQDNSQDERETKTAAYAQVGIPHLWLFDPPVSFTAYRLEDAKYVEVVHADNGETVTAPGPVPVEIDTAKLP